MEIKVMARRGVSIREMAKELGCSRNTIRRYLREADAQQYKPREARPAKLDPYKDYLLGRVEAARPHWIPAAVLLRGFAAPGPSADSAHCELGFGQGVSINHHAAATPGLFIGTDFNPAHAAHASTLADASGSGARLYDDSFEQLLNRCDLPQFDSISLHGIWTWVSRDNHKIITEFARRHLKPGGVFYISYNCFPGWSPNYPLRQLFALHDRFGSAPHGAVERVEAALKFSENLLAAQPNYAKLVPNLGSKLKSIMEQNRHYLAHEYFNRGRSGSE